MNGAWQTTNSAYNMGLDTMAADPLREVVVAYLAASAPSPISRKQQLYMHSKYLILILLLTLALQVAGQQLPKGTYVLLTGFTYTEFNFKSDFKFSYKYSSCTGGQEGIGSYTLANRELTLIFDNPKVKSLLLTPSICKTVSHHGTSYLSFSFYDPKDTSAIAGVHLEYQDISNGNSYHAVSNNQGKAQFKIRKNQFPIDVTVTYIGVAPETLTLDSVGDYSIVYPLNFDFIRQTLKGQNLKFIINNFDEGQLVLRPDKEKEFRTFKRK